MHSKGICHRDLKPRNILLSERKARVKITDFNVSKCFRKLNGQLFAMTTHTGTIAFSSPETLSSGRYR